MVVQRAIDYSVVIPVYYNQGTLTSTFESLERDVIQRLPERQAEIVFVDDGSGDSSLNELLCMQKRAPDLIRIIKLSRNFGQVNALIAGARAARGNCIVTMSADGQDPATYVQEMLKCHWDEKYEIVICARQGRDESIYRVWTSRLFYRLIRRLSFPNMPVGGFDFVLLGRRAANAWLRQTEAHPFFQGAILQLGFNVKFIEYHRRKRTIGRSRWTFGMKLTYLIDGVVGYSYFPIRFMALLGVLISLVGFVYALIILIVRLTWGLPVEGWAPLMIVVLVVGGFHLLMLGIIGEYVWRILAQVRDRPAYIIEEMFEDDRPGELETSLPPEAVTP